MPHRAILWIVFFALLLAMAEYGLALQSARPHHSRVEVELDGEPDPAKRESRTNARDGNESLGYPQ